MKTVQRSPRRVGAGEESATTGVSLVWPLLKAGVSNRNLLLGIALEAVFFAAICVLLTRRDVSLIWPLSALSFVFTGLAAKYFLKEDISALRWAGIVLIMAGAGIITWSEKVKERNAALRDPASVGWGETGRK